MKKKRIPLKFFEHKKRRILLIMKWCAVFTLFFSFGTFASVVAQKEKVSLNMQQVSVKTLFQEIQKQTGLFFVYNTEQCENFGPIDIKVQNETLEQVLESIFRNRDFNYQFEGNVIVVKAGKQPPLSLPQQKKVKITGRVTDKTGNSLPGVSILIEGTATGTATNIEGRYELECPQTPELTLLFSFIGMQIHKETVGNRSIINVVMEEEISQMEEVVVNGIFTRKAESFTGSVTTFKAEALRQAGNQNVLSSLKNLDPSFIMDDNLTIGSDPNKMSDIQIRGASSLPTLGSSGGNPNMPLFILDGFEASAQKIYDLDMNRVESVTILKDAAAKAIYGSKAANGVIVVETFRPKAGVLRASYSGDLNITMPDLTSYDLCDAWEKLQVEDRAGRYSMSNPVMNQALREQYDAIYKEIQRGVNTYWLSKPLRVGIGQKHSLYMEGGDDRFRYGIDLAYNNIAGVMKESMRNNISGGITLTYRYKSLTFRNYLTLTSNKSQDSPYGSFGEYSRLNPYWTNIDENGRVKKILGTFESVNGTLIPYTNPYYNGFLNTKIDADYLNVSDNIYIEWQVFETLKLVGRAGINYQDNNNRTFYPASHTKFYSWSGDDYFRRGSYNLSNMKSFTVKADLTANYSKAFGKNLVYGNAGWNMSELKNDGYGVQAEGLIDDHMDHISLAKQYKKDGKPSGSEGITREIGLLGAINYSYDNRYLADFSFRMNGSSIYGSNKRWGSFWSTGIGWNIHHESFLHQVEVLNRLKLRASIGTTGSQDILPYEAMTTFGYFEDIYYDNIVGTYLLGMANKNLKWQQTEEFNAGFDLEVWNRLSLRYDYYIATTNNLLTSVTLPTSTGFSTYAENLGKSRNIGMELTASYRLINRPAQRTFLTLFASAANNKNKLLEISNGLRKWNETQDEQSLSTDKNQAVKPKVRYIEGQSMSAIWAVRSLGINPSDGKEVFLDKDGNITYTWNPEDQIIAGDNAPKLRGSFGINAEHKGWGVNMSFYYRLGGDLYNQTLVDRVENVDITYNTDRRVFTNRWATPGDKAYFKGITDLSPTRPTTRFVEKLNEVKLSTINLSYDFSYLNFIKRSKIERLKMAFYMNDVFTISSVKTERGLDYPFARTCSFSLQITL